MIKAKDLRIGNFIFDDDGEIAKVTGLRPYEHSIRCDEGEGCDFAIDIYSADGKIRKGFLVASQLANPIPLTPEWLERCGLVKIEDEFADIKVWSKSLIEIGLKDGNFYLHSSCTDPWYNQTIGNPIEFVSQLQNLFFALTGEELNVKL